VNFPAPSMFLACMSLQGPVTQKTTRISVQLFELVTSAYTFLYKLLACTQGHGFIMLISVKSTSTMFKRLVQT